MDDPRKSRTAELFNDALNLPPDDRRAYLSQICADDEKMRKKVEDLLDAYMAMTSASSAQSGSIAEPVPSFLAPETVLELSERYDQIEPVGRGGMGIVFRARDREINKIVALKLLHPSISHNEHSIERFRNEIRIALDITHKNVCRTYGLERFNETIVISMEYVEGETLRSILNRVKGVSVPQGLIWAQEICDALGAAHERRIVHRDLKPENIMVDADGQIKVMDFGIARSIEPGGGGTATVIGTPGYMSPEQAHGRPVEPTSDIYSLGLVLCELFTGVRTDSTHLVLPNEKNSYLPLGIQIAIRRCLEEVPADRYNTVSQLKIALTQLSGVSNLGVGEARPKRAVVRAAFLFVLVSAALLGGWFWAVPNYWQTSPRMKQESEITRLAFGPAGHLLASASEDKTVAIWDIATQERIHILSGHLRAVTCIAFSANGKRIASGSADNTIKVWSVETGKQEASFADSKVLTAIAMSPDGQWLASTSDESVKVWDVRTGSISRTFRHADAVHTLAFSSDGRMIASGSADRTVGVWNVETGLLVAGPFRHEDAVKVVAFSPDGRLLASGSLDKTIKLWSINSWQDVQTLWHGAQLYDLIFSQDSSRLMSLSTDWNLKLWVAPTWVEAGSLEASEFDDASVLAIGPDLKTLAGGSMDGAIKLGKVPRLAAQKK